MRPLTVLALLPVCTVMAQTPVTIELVPFATGLPDIVDIAHAGDDRLFAVLQNGYIHVVNADGTVLPTPFLDIDDRVSSGGERGLLFRHRSLFQDPIEPGNRVSVAGSSLGSQLNGEFF